MLVSKKKLVRTTWVTPYLLELINFGVYCLLSGVFINNAKKFLQDLVFYERLGLHWFCFLFFFGFEVRTKCANNLTES